MKLITMVQVSGANEEDENTMAKLLTVSFASRSHILRILTVVLDILHDFSYSGVHCRR